MVCRRRDTGRRTAAGLVALRLLLVAALLCVHVVSAHSQVETGRGNDVPQESAIPQTGEESAADAAGPPPEPVPLEPRSVAARVSAQRVAEGGRLALTVELDPVDASMVEVQEPDYPAGLQRIGGVQVSSRGPRLEHDGGTEVRIDLQATQAGRWVLQPFSILTPVARYRSEPLLIEVSLRDNPAVVPYDLEWVVHAERIHEGQSIAVTLDMVNVTEFAFPEQMSIQPPSGALFEEAQGVGEIESTRYGDVELFRVPVASFLLTPSAAGNLTLPAAEIRAFGLTRRAASLPLVVEPLPDGVGDTGAVGDFSFVARLSVAEIGLDEAVELKLEAQGVGNLGFLQFPTFTAEGLVVSDSDSTENLLAGPNGYIGTRTQTVRLRPTGAGDFRVAVDSFAWFDPRANVVRREPARSFPIRVVDRSEAAPPATRELPPLLGVEDIRRVATVNLYRFPGTYLTIMPALIMVTVVVYVRRRRRETIALFSAVLLLGAGFLVPTPRAEPLERVAEHYQEGSYDAAFALSRQLLVRMPDHPGLLYNAGLTAFAAGDPASAVLYLRRAVVMRPFFSEARAALTFVESELGLDRQFALKRSIHPDVPLIASLVLFYLLAVLLVIPYGRRKAGYAITVIAAIFALASMLGVFGYSLYARGEPVAVVGPHESELKRIPEDAAEVWLTLPAGTAVQPLASRDGYTLIRTGYGLDGWMPGNRLMIE